MNRLLGTKLSSGDFYRPVRNNFVRVHVALRSAAGLPDPKRKMVVQLSCDHLISRLHDESGLVLGKLAEVAIGQRAGLFQNAQARESAPAA